MSNSVDPDETAHYEPSHLPSHLDICCLQKPIIIDCGSERLKDITSIYLGRYNRTQHFL